MARKIGIPGKKDFLSTFYIPLSGYPVACKIDNISLLSELVDKTVLVFGKYDLVFCLRNSELAPDPAYAPAIVTRSFCEPLQLARIPAAFRDASEIQIYFIQPLHAHIKVGKPSNLKLWDSFTSWLMGKTWVEAQVEGQIAVKIAAVPASPDLELEVEELASQTRAITTAVKDEMAIQQKEVAIDLEMLVEEIQKMIDQREEDRASVNLEQVAEQVQKIIGQREEDRASVNLEQVAEQVQKIIGQREEDRASVNLEQVAEQVQKIIGQREEDRASVNLEQLAEQVQKIIGQREEDRASVNLEQLAEQVQKIIGQREEDRAGIKEAARQDPNDQEQSGMERLESMRPDQGEPEVNMAKVTELVLNILHTREAARARQEYDRSQHRTGERQPYFNTPHSDGTRHPERVVHPQAPVQKPLEQIPSRPGLEAYIHNPPPKPPSAGG